MSPEKMGFKSPNRRANAIRRKNPPAFTPSSPSYSNSRFSPDPSLPAHVVSVVSVVVSSVSAPVNAKSISHRSVLTIA